MYFALPPFRAQEVRKWGADILILTRVAPSFLEFESGTQYAVERPSVAVLRGLRPAVDQHRPLAQQMGGYHEDPL